MKINRGTFDTVATVLITAISFLIGKSWGETLTVMSLLFLLGSLVILWLSIVYKGDVVFEDKKNERR